jgi:NADPH-dependent stearoyl-CoA 9-desaturase
VRAGEKSQKEVLKDLKGISVKMRAQVTKDYIAWPLVSGLVCLGVDLGLAALGYDLEAVQTTPRSRREKARLKARQALRTAQRKSPTNNDHIIKQLVARKSFREPFKRTAQANAVSNIMRNLWAHAIIFCGHFPDQTYTFSEEETKDETRGATYVRQLIGAANIEGGPMFHVISGNLGYQVEHHLFPDMPSTRYGEIAPKVREICKKYELPYNTGPFFQQWGMVNRTIIRLAFPGGKPRPKPGPYQGDTVLGRGEKHTENASTSGTS